MKIVVIGGSGLIGSKVVSKLTAHGEQAVAASPSSDVNTITAEGLAEVLSAASTDRGGCGQLARLIRRAAPTAACHRPDAHADRGSETGHDRCADTP